MSGTGGRARSYSSRGRGRVPASLPTSSAPPNVHIDPSPSPTPIESTHTEASSAAGSTTLACGSTVSRMLVRPNGKEFIPSHQTVAIISSIMKGKYEQPWTGWKDIPQEVRNMWFGEFQKYCRWDPEHDVAVKRIWGLKCADTIRANLASIRSRKSKGKWLADNVLDALWVKWTTDPEFKEKSERNKQNRSASEGGCLNKGGSISLSEHKRRYTRELGREATIPELFCRLNHNDETDQWSTPRAARTYSSYEKLKEDVAATGESVDDSALFFQATGGKNKRGRAYGFGSEVAFYSSSGSGSGCNRSESQSAATATNNDELIQRIAGLETQLIEERAEHADRFSQLESELASLKGFIQQLQTGHHNSEVAPTTSSRPPTINEDDEDDLNL